MGIWRVLVNSRYSIGFQRSLGFVARRLYCGRYKSASYNYIHTKWRGRIAQHRHFIHKPILLEMYVFYTRCGGYLRMPAVRHYSTRFSAFDGVFVHNNRVYIEKIRHEWSFYNTQHTKAIVPRNKTLGKWGTDCQRLFMKRYLKQSPSGNTSTFAKIKE